MLYVDDKYVEELKKEGKRIPRISSLYSMDIIFKKIYKIPKFIPVAMVCLLEHGANFQFSFFYERLLKSKNDLIFFENIFRVNEYYKQTGNKSYPIGPLYPKYRKLKNYQPKHDRSGTLAFPSHSSSQHDFSSGYKKYANDLKLLPEKYHPITICMYYYDIINGHYKIFEEEGFTVITNGYIANPKFPDYLYEHISSYKYTTSNHAGSYAFYSLEMGIPFFLYGDDIKTNFKDFGLMNGVNMKDFVEENFLKTITKQMIFDINTDITITPDLKRSIEVIIDKDNQLSVQSVRNLVLKNWIKILLVKIFSALPFR